MSFVTLVLAILLFARISVAQDLAHEVPADTLDKYGIYDGDLLGPSFYAGRRAKVLEQMPPHTIAIILAAPTRTRSNDVEYLYHQTPNLYYLTGCTEAHSAMLVSNDPILLNNGKRVHEVLFVQPRDPAQETWTGKRLGPQGAISVLGSEASLPIDSLNEFTSNLFSNAQDSTKFYYEAGVEQLKDPLLDSTISSTQSLDSEISHRYPNLVWSDETRKIIIALRAVKTEPELQLMRKAIAISNEAHNAVLSEARPGWHEYEIQALAEYTFGKNGAEYTGYPCIVGSGPNSTILHYESNRRKIKAGDFIEMDMGAEYHGYSADVTRSFPISGSFSPAQKEIYELVFAAQDSGIKCCKIGAPFNSAHYAAVSIIGNGLKRLGIISDAKDYRKYFMHGTSHYLGLDVHDAGTHGNLMAGNVLTVEPGIYIPAGSPCDPKWWNIGCRIEDDILVSTKGPVILSNGSPRNIKDVEALLKQGRSHSVNGRSVSNN